MPLDLTDLKLETAARACRAPAYQEEQARQADGEPKHGQPYREKLTSVVSSLAQAHATSSAARNEEKNLCFGHL
jgi:hypothetical protein